MVKINLKSKTVMRRLLYALITIVWSSGVLYAQSEDMETIKDKINEIKRDNINFIYGESTNSSKEEAEQVAKKELFGKIKEWVKATLPQEEINSVAAKKIDNFTQTISLPRGKNYRVFVYVNKNDIYALLPVNKVIMVSEKDTVKKQPDEEVVISHDEVMPKPEDQQIAPSKAENLKALDVDTIKSSQPPLTPLYKDGIVAEILAVSDLSDVKRMLNNNKYRSKYYYFKVKNEKDVGVIKEKRAVLVIYNRSNEKIIAVLRPNVKSNLVDLKTNQEDTLMKYPDCNAIAIVEIN